MPKDGPRRRKNLFRHPKQFPSGRGYTNGPFNNHTKDAAVQTEHDDQRNDDAPHAATVPAGNEHRDGEPDGSQPEPANELRDGAGNADGDDNEEAAEGDRPAPEDDTDEPGRSNVILGRAHKFFVNYMRERDAHNATQFPPARDGVEAFHYFNYAMDLLGTVMFQCRAQMEVMKEVFMPILLDEIDFVRQYQMSLQWINNLTKRLKQIRTYLLVLVVVTIKIMFSRRTIHLSKT